MKIMLISLAVFAWLIVAFCFFWLRSQYSWPELEECPMCKKLIPKDKLIEKYHPVLDVEYLCPYCKAVIA